MLRIVYFLHYVEKKKKKKIHAFFINNIFISNARLKLPKT